MTKTKGNEEIQLKEHVRGAPKSGRFWKSQKDRMTTIVKSRKKVGLKKLKELREEKDRVKELSTSIKEARKTEIRDKAIREQANKKKKEENARKSEVVQVIKNSAKLKRMKKKQLRKIEKRDTTVIEKDPVESAVPKTKVKAPSKKNQTAEEMETT